MKANQSNEEAAHWLRRSQERLVSQNKSPQG